MKDLRIVEKNYTMYMAVIFFYEIFGTLNEVTILNKNSI
jgi:hypothetical protein